MVVIAYCDGACFGNPGPMGIGIVLWKNGKKIAEISEFIGNGTNNIAEYNAVIHALSNIKRLGEKEVIIRSDSQLLIKQMNGEYKVKEKHLKALKLKIDELRIGMHVKFEHIPRERNRSADYLSKKAIEVIINNVAGYNAYILERTIKNFEELEKKLKEAGFNFIKKNDNIKVNVSFDQIENFYNLAKNYLNSPYNYIDIQFPKEKKTVLVFSGRLIYMANKEENETVREWAISKGLPKKEADWATSY